MEVKIRRNSDTELKDHSLDSSQDLENPSEFEHLTATPINKKLVNSTCYYSEAKPGRSLRKFPSIESQLCMKKHYKRESFESLVKSSWSFSSSESKIDSFSKNKLQMFKTRARSHTQYKTGQAHDNNQARKNHVKSKSLNSRLDRKESIDKIIIASYNRRYGDRNRRNRKGFKSAKDLTAIKNKSVYRIPSFKCSKKPDFSRKINSMEFTFCPKDFRINN